MEEIVLQTKNLTKRYKDYTALDNVSITLHKKHIYGFIGENGAGKTTFMRIVTGLSLPDSGTYSILGKEDAAGREKMRKYIGSMIEKPALYPNFSVLQNMEVQRALVGNPDRQASDKVLEMMDLSDHKMKKVSALSTGTRQRLGIAMALVGNPKLLILDEPANSLDPRYLAALRNILKTLSQEREVTVFISSHILSELYQLATDYILIHRGKVIETLSHEELEAKCRNYVCVRTGNVPYALTVIDRELENPSYEVVADDTIHLFVDFEKMENISEVFIRNQVVVKEFYVKEESLEDYFLSVMGRQGSG